MTIRLLLKASYGRVLAYPDCENSRTFANMLHSKTLTHANIGYIKALGFSVTWNPGMSLSDVQ